ncbi:MAG: hypothetical protein A3K19_13900 [Lentisphaerae bacterium RIFOXYB12_FULL_65_16]|nr:MAG: hypothetical protein A3K18_18045 [Lentisphaerae bacterium RIFOXYA12_64_32]OGV94129.1 MAG: hypothetical protein A3K19_13900 [Lentisphaerae bacterium RIFOXYB12_FULL_65_16]
MIYAIIHILVGAAFSVCYKVAANRNYDTVAVQLIMYAAGASLAAAFALAHGGLVAQGPTIPLGLTGAFLMLVSVRTFFMAMHQGGLAIGWTCVNLSVVIPLLVAICFWGEKPGMYQIVGLVLMIPCVVLFGDPKSHIEGNRTRWTILVAVATVCSGLGVILMKIVSDLAYPAAAAGAAHAEILFSYLTYCLAAGGLLLAPAVVRIPKPRFRGGEVRLGVIMGLACVVGLWAFIMAFTVLPAIVFLPLKAAAGVILTALLAVYAWREHLTRRQKLGILLGAACAALVNVR